MKTFDKNTSRCARGTASGGVCVVCGAWMPLRCSRRRAERVGRARSTPRPYYGRLNGAERRKTKNRKSTIERSNSNDVLVHFFSKQNNDPTRMQYAMINIRKTLSRRRSEYIDGGFFRRKCCALRRRWPPLLDDRRNRWYAPVGVTIGRDKVMRCDIIIIITVDESVGGWWGPGGPKEYCRDDSVRACVRPGRLVRLVSRFGRRAV